MKGRKIMIIIWSVLALASFVSGVFHPVLFWKIVNIVFGIINCGAILSFAVLLRNEALKEEL